MSNVIRIGPLRIAPEVRCGKYSGKWILDVPKSASRKGCRQRRFFANRELALQAAKEYQRHAYVGAPVSQEPSPCKVALLQAIAEWSEEQELEVAAGMKRQSSLDRDYNHFKSLKAFFGDALLSEITERKLKEYIAWRKSDGNSIATIKTDVVACGKLLRWTFRQSMLPTMPTLPKVRVPTPKIEVPTGEDIERIISFLPEDQKAPVKLIVETGCRKGEVLNLRWEDVELDRRLIHIRSRIGWTVKTEHSERTLPISERMAALLKTKQGNGSDFVFPGLDPKKPRENLKTGFYTAVRKARIMRGNRLLHVTVHILRKAYATWAANEQKLHPALLKKLLGHSPTSTVTDGWYVGVTEEALRGGVRTIDMGLNPPSEWQQSGSNSENENGPIS